MLGRTANGLFWMFRYLERAENTARLVDAGFRIALTRSTSADKEWESVISTAGVLEPYLERHGVIEASAVVDFLLRDRSNPSSVLSVISLARDNARVVRTALTREVWEAVNDSWLTLKDALARPVRERDLPEMLALIRQKSALVRGALHGTMLRNDIYDFSRLGTFIERADNTARILDVKYYVLLPSLSFVGSSLDNVQWDNVLRSLSGQSAYRWLNEGRPGPAGITHFLVFDRRFPRSLAFCLAKVRENLGHLTTSYGTRLTAHDHADALAAHMAGLSIETIFEHGLHQCIGEFLAANARLSRQIEADYRFYA